MYIDEAKLAHELARTHNVTTRQRLQAIGFTRRQVDRLSASGRLVAAGPGVLRAAVPPATLHQRAAWACMVTNGAIAYPTAGKLWELRRTPHEPIIHVVVPWERRLDPIPGIRLRRSRHLPSCDLVERPDGITVTTPPRTVFDAAAYLSADDLQSMIEDALYRRLFAPITLARLAQRVGHPCREGTALITRVLASRDLRATPVASEYELRLERALVARGFPVLTRQHAIQLSPGRWVHPDLGLPDDGFFVEVDHRRWHDSSEDRAYDAWRDRRLRLLGCWVERVSDLAIDHRLDETVEDLWAAWQRARSNRVAGSVA